MSADKTESTTASTALSIAADRLRDSAKWLVASLGAVAAIVFAGLTVSGIGDLDGGTPGYRLALAVSGATIAVICVVAALYLAMRLAGASTTTLADLVDAPSTDRGMRPVLAQLRNDPALAAWDGDLSKFVGDYRRAWDRYVQEARAATEQEGSTPNDLVPAQLALTELNLMRSIASRLLGTASFVRLQRSFGSAGRAIAALLVAAAAGAMLFGWATLSAPPTSPDIDSRPQAAVLRPNEATAKEIARLTGGSNCPTRDEIKVVVLSEPEETKFSVLTLPTRRCAPLTLTVLNNEVTDT